MRCRTLPIIPPLSDRGPVLPAVPAPLIVDPQSHPPKPPPLLSDAVARATSRFCIVHRQEALSARHRLPAGRLVSLLYLVFGNRRAATRVFKAFR